MSITLTHPTAGPGATPMSVTLPTDLIWTNEFGWAQIEQAAAYTTTGALILDQWTKQAGRPMELRGEVDYGWILRGPLETLDAWVRQAGVQYTLNRNGQRMTVVFDRPGLEATPIVPYADPEPSDAYTLTLRFLIL